MRRILKSIGKFIVRGGIYLYVRIIYKAEVIGIENVPKNGPLIFCGNHRNYIEPPLMIATAKRDLRFLAKDELHKNLFLAFLGVVFDAIYVKRDSKDIGPIKEALKGLKNGDCIALFPEGTRNGLEKGEKVKDGAAFFAVKSGVKVIPCGIKGGTKTGEKVIITYGKPLDFSNYKDCKNKEDLDQVTEEIMKNILELAK